MAKKFFITVFHLLLLDLRVYYLQGGDAVQSGTSSVAFGGTLSKQYHVARSKDQGRPVVRGRSASHVGLQGSIGRTDRDKEAKKYAGLGKGLICRRR
jgi:hypothetical protein